MAKENEKNAICGDKQTARDLISEGPQTYSPRETLLLLENAINDRKKAEEALQQSQDQLRKFSVHLEQQLEAEKKRLATEIHDELGQMLTALQIDLSWLEKRLPRYLEPLRAKTRAMMTMIDDADEVVKRISSSLRLPILDDLGLVEAVKWLAAQFQARTGIKCSLRIAGTDIFDKNQAIDVFRVLQEVLTNVARHSEATRVSIDFRTESNKLEITIKDNGRGITESEINSRKSYGLMGMQERVIMLKGTLKIEGIVGKGTTVKLSVPIEEQK